MQTTTQPTTQAVGKGANRILEGIKFFQQFFQRATPAPLTRDQHIAAFIKGRKCNCHGGTCGSCEHLIKDVFGD